MYIRLVRAHDDPTKEAEMTRVSHEQLLPAYRRIPGFQRHTGGVDRAGRQIVGITTWETEEQANSVRDALGDVIAQLQGAGVVFDVAPDVYEVTVQS
jgi:hypothetical protein